MGEEKRKEKKNMRIGGTITNDARWPVLKLHPLFYPSHPTHPPFFRLTFQFLSSSFDEGEGGGGEGEGGS